MNDYATLPELLRSRPVSYWPGVTWTLGEREIAMTEERNPNEATEVEVDVSVASPEPEPEEDTDDNTDAEEKDE